MRDNENVTGNIRSTLKTPMRFWNMNHYAEDIESIIRVDESEAITSMSNEDRVESTIKSVFSDCFNEKIFADKLYENMIKQFNAENWEKALVHGLKVLFPFYEIERVGGSEEANHGTDILVKLPGIINDSQYAIAIQVKDYDGFVSEDVISQINKADTYENWNNRTIKLIDKFVFITKAGKDWNLHLPQNNDSVHFVFAEDLKQILNVIGQRYVGIEDFSK